MNNIFHLFNDKNLVLGNLKLSILSVIVVILVLIFSYILSHLSTKILKKEFLKKSSLHKGTKLIIERLIKVSFFVIGFFVSFQILGVNLDSLAIFAGIIGLGIGFGIQNILSNFISGIIILFEQPIMVGDYLTIGSLDGVVTEIRTRSTTVTTRDNIRVIVPNSTFISENVINWSREDSKVRIHIPIGIEETASKLDLARDILLQIASEHPKVLKEPKPSVWFETFGNSTFNLTLLVWVESAILRHYIVSDINFEIAKKYAEYGVDISYQYTNLLFKNDMNINSINSNNDNNNNIDKILNTGNSIQGQVQDGNYAENKKQNVNNVNNTNAQSRNINDTDRGSLNNLNKD